MAVDVYRCKEKGCACYWKDNGDGTASLFDATQKSCSVCENQPSNDLHYVGRLVEENPGLYTKYDGEFFRKPDEGLTSTPPTKKEVVDHPAHYTGHPSGVECIQITEHMGFNLGNALKYIWRADLKGKSEEDLKKAIWYINRELEKRAKQ